MKCFYLISLIVLITILGFFVRFYLFGKSPDGSYIDESGQGYNAYSILKTGRDEFGKAYPFIFRSFTDFKTPVYIYLVVPLIPIFSLSSFTVRLPALIFSVLSIPLFYLLLAKITPDKFKPPLPLLTILLLAISPWHILYSRTSFECNVAMFFFLGGTFFFYLALKKPFYLTLSALMFALAIPAYHNQRIITPLTLIFLFWRFRTILLSKSYLKPLIISLILGLMIISPTLLVATTPGFLSRANTLNIFSQAKQKPAGFINNPTVLPNFLLNSPLFLSSKEFFSLYFSYFSPRYMFYLGDYGPRSSFPNLATYFIWQLPFYLLGLYFLFKDRNLKELRSLMIFLLLVAPLPAALTRDPYITIRSANLLIPQLVIISLGIVKVLFYLQSWLKTVFLMILMVFVIHSLLNLYSSGIILNDYLRSQEWNYGWEEAVNTIKTLPADKPIVVDNAREEPYIHLLFYLQFDPQTYQADNFEVSQADYYLNMERNNNKKIGRIEVRPIVWEKDLKVDQYLIGDMLAISLQQIKEHQLILVKEIKYYDQSPALRIVQTNPQFEQSQQKDYLDKIKSKSLN